MTEHKRFKIRSLEQLQTEAGALGVTLPLTQDLSVLGEAVTVCGHRLKNRFAVHPMEGFDADSEGTPGPLSFRRYARYASGGSALIWFEATAVIHEGRSNAGQFSIHEGNVDVFRRLVSETRAAAVDSGATPPVLVLQLTHSGRYSKPAGLPAPLIAHHSPILDPLHKLPADYPLVTDEYLDELQLKFVQAAKLAKAAGFDGVDVKSCHRYLVSELLASFTRSGKYGGSFENRTRFLRETIEGIIKAVPGLIVTTRMSAYDAISYPYGWGVSKDDFRVPDLTEPLQLVGILKELGVGVLNISIGNPYYNPHYGRPYDFPIQGAQVPGEHPLAGIRRFMEITATVQKQYPDLPVIGSGYTWLRQFMPNVAAAVVNSGRATLIGQGRGAFAYPESVNDILQKGGMDPAKCCVTCSACTQIMRDGGKTGCVVRDSDIYGPQYRLARRFAVDRLRAEARRCRECEEATCTVGCPAQIDIPEFLKAFADGDIARSYDILRSRNVLPEMCGFVCPVAEQCQGQCLEHVFCKNPLPIQDIQLVVARTARLLGLTGARIPAQASGRRVAVVGGGPAGLAAAVKLLEAGHHVTIFEKGAKLGGVPDSTIPETRYADADVEVTSILKPAFEHNRLDVRYGQALGRDLHFDSLRDQFDAVFLATGLSGGMSLGRVNGVVDALKFLADVKSGKRTQVPERIAVLGGGNTAMDAGTTALRCGARDVYMVYRRSFNEMPAWKKERDEFLEASGHLLVLTQPLGYETNGNGHLKALKVARTELGAPGADGRRSPQVVPNTEFLLPVELVIEALGQELDESLKQELTALGLSRKGLVSVPPQSQKTAVSGVFAGGDITNGGATAVQGIVEGMRAAVEISQFLNG